MRGGGGAYRSGGVNIGGKLINLAKYSTIAKKGKRTGVGKEKVGAEVGVWVGRGKRGGGGLNDFLALKDGGGVGLTKGRGT